MARQRSLFDGAKLRVTPTSQKSGPRLWIRRLAIWANPNDVIRDITLRPGLNVIWSPDPTERQRTRTIRALGHGGGKTLFCRLLRYSLGEDRFAPEDQRDRIAQVLNDGFVGAEVVLDGVEWAIVRPIGSRRRHVAAQNGSLQAIVSGEGDSTGLDPFLDAVEQAFISNSVRPLIPGSLERRPWLTALAWLTRDQECRFDHVLDWRSAVSGSDSPVRSLSRNEILESIRALIRAIIPEEQALRSDISELERRRGHAEHDSQYQHRAASQLRAKLAQQFSIELNELPPGPLSATILKQAALRRLSAVSETSGGDDGDLTALRSQLELARDLAERVASDLAHVDARIETCRWSISKIKAEMPGSSFSTDEAENPVCPVCEVPIDRALAEGCRLSHKLPDLETLRDRHRRRQDELGEEEKRLSGLRQEHQSVALKLGAARDKVARLRTAVEASERAWDAREIEWYNARRLVDDAERLAELFESEESARHAIGDFEVALEQRRTQVGVLRESQKDVIQRVSMHFDAIIGELAPNARGQVLLTGNGLELRVDLDGDRSTAAIDSLKVLAFDLAAMCLSIEGNTCLPAFLVHDSPREADLGLTAYHQLFRLVRSLEAVSEAPAFQYILTTTTAPPKEMIKDECLRATLGGAPAEERLLRRDL